MTDIKDCEGCDRLGYGIARKRICLSSIFANLIDNCPCQMCIVKLTCDVSGRSQCKEFWANRGAFIYDRFYK